LVKPIILSGMQPTGNLHLGNLEGALKNWVNLQNQGTYEMYCCIVDWHALTSDFADTSDLKNKIFEMALDYLSSGLDPEKVAIFVQSQVKEHAELHLLFSMITPVPWLERVPSYKEKSQELNLDSYGFLGYPLLQVADILVYKANFVPVGKDQLPHIELTREVARRFNGFYGDLFPEPEALLTKFPVILGTDGRKMSKSYGNDITIADSEEITSKKISKMFTDPARIHKNDPGHPDECPVYLLHQIYTEEYWEIHEKCKAGQLGCVEDKGRLAETLNKGLKPIREKRKNLQENPKTVWDALESGRQKAQTTASRTLKEVRERMKLL
jgi:tryptophanyl-tRNA synthetase